MSRWPMVRLGEVLEPAREMVDVVADRVYRTAGIYSFGRGLFWRSPLSGAETSYQRFGRLRTGQLVFSKLFAWEGALAVVSADFDGAFVSSEFPSFSLDESEVDRAYLGFYLRWSPFYRSLSTSGMGNRRQRVNPSALLAAFAPLPPLPEQRQIAKWLGEIEGQSSRLSGISVPRARDTDLADRAVELVIRELDGRGWKLARMSDVAEVNPRKEKLDNQDITFVPMSAVADMGKIVGGEIRSLREVRGGYRQFRRGDVLFARITPCMENGKVAIFDEQTEYGLGSTEFQVIRSCGVSAEWLYCWMRRRMFRADAAAAFQGTAGQQRVPSAFLEACEILVPPSKDEEQWAVRRIGHVVSVQTSWRRALTRRSELARALLPSALNQVFGSLS